MAGRGSRPRATAAGEGRGETAPRLLPGGLAEKLRKHGAQTWLVNTGWTGGAYGVGKLMARAHTRAMVRAALAGELDKGACAEDPIFNLSVPTPGPGVPSAARLRN